LSDPSRAVFLSYASQDAKPAGRLCEDLRTAGIEVWLDRTELRGGDDWDASIRRQIKTCYLFMPMISVNTQAREEGYFRREWNLAVARTLDMAADRAFLLPVVIDATPDAAARVPEKFREVQWTRLPGGEATAGFVARVASLTGAADPGLAAVAQVVDRSIGSRPAAAAPALRESPAHGASSARPRAPSAKRWRSFAPAASVALALIAAAVLIPPWHRREQARSELLPRLQERVEKMVRSNREILDLAAAVEAALPNDPTLTKIWPMISTRLSLDTDPEGAEVYWKDYGQPAEEWRPLGITPIKNSRVPKTFLRLEIRKQGFQTVELAAPRTYGGFPTLNERLKLDPEGKLPVGMVRMPKSETAMQIVGLEKYGPKAVPEFLVDKYEVTNREFKAFVDAGGYTNGAYWKVPIVEAGKEIPLKEALARFMDRTGRRGPASWEAGTFPDGGENQPVTGVSWYEAAAYAVYAHKRLPTAFHFAAVADTSRSEFLVPMSNFNGKSAIAVGSRGNISTIGVYDIAGNAREWTANQSGRSDQRFILGGGYTDPSYAFNDSFIQPALDRSESNGFRCITTIGDDPALAKLEQPIVMAFRDYTKEMPVDDATFAVFARQFVYDKTPVNAKLEMTSETDAYRSETVSIDAAYNNERLQVHLFLPKHHAGRLQPIVFFPGSNGIDESAFDTTLVDNRLLFLIKSGRALIWPIYKGTFERRDSLKSDLQETTVRYKDHVVAWGKDYARTIDYLETRADMQADKVGYFGWSWGGFMGGIIPAIEKRVRSVVLHVGGMDMEPALPEVDQINYIPRVIQPVLMMNGSFDMFFPVETSQKPMFRFLGTPQDKKKMIVYPSGHLVPWPELIRETLAWYDATLGPVQ
jgi:hypothetical protein